MSNYAMSRYFQNVGVLSASAAKPNPENVKELEEVGQNIHTHAKKLLSAGTPDDKIHTKGQHTTLERINQLIDGGIFCPLSTPYNPEDSTKEKIGIVSTGIVKGLGRINGKQAVVIASDNRKVAGTQVPGQADSLLRGSDTARMLGIPLVYILNCSDVKLDKREKVCPNHRGGGAPFYRNSELSQLSVPVIVGIYGTNPVDGGYHITSPTALIAHEEANMAIGGTGTVGGMGSRPYVDLEGTQGMIDATRKMKNDPPGSVSICYNVTGFFREVYAEEFNVLDSIKKYMDYIPAFNPEFFRVGASKAPAIQGKEPHSVVPRDTRRIYDMYNVLRALPDGGGFMEYKKDYGPEMITSIAKVNGLPVGVVTNRQDVLAMQDYPSYPEYRDKGTMGVSSKFYRQGLTKMNEFVTLCGRNHLPIIWVQDTAGIDVDNEAERAELLGLGQNLIYSIRSTKLPMFEITLRKGTAAAHCAFGDPQGNDNNVFSIDTATTEINITCDKTMTGTMYSRRLVKNQDSGGDLQGTIDKMNQLIQYYIDTSIPAYCAKAGLVDEIVDLPNIGNYVMAFADAVYQNPRSICPIHQMTLPRIIKGCNENGQNAKAAGAEA